MENSFPFSQLIRSCQLPSCRRLMNRLRVKIYSEIISQANHEWKVSSSVINNHDPIGFYIIWFNSAQSIDNVIQISASVSSAVGLHEQISTSLGERSCIIKNLFRLPFFPAFFFLLVSLTFSLASTRTLCVEQFFKQTRERVRLLVADICSQIISGAHALLCKFNHVC